MASALDAEKYQVESKLDQHKELWRIYTRVLENDKEVCAQNPDKITEISFLLKCTSSNDSSFEVSSISNRILVQLFKKDLIKQDYLLRMLLSFSATARNLTCIMESLIEILLFEMSVQVGKSGSYSCPYKIRSPPHPLVTVLQQRPDAFYAIVDEIRQKYIEFIDTNNGEMKHLLPVIKPFLSFVLLDPNRRSSWESQTLHNTMIDLLKMVLDYGEKETAYEMAYFLLHVYCCRKNDATTVAENMLMSKQLTECFIGEEAIADEVSEILTHCGYQVLCNCHKMLEANLGIKTSLNFLLKLFQRHPKVLLKDEFVFLIALLLYQSPSVYREDVLKLALFILPCYLSYESAKAVSIVRLFYLPLLQILFRGSAESEVHHRCQKLAKNIFINIQRTIEGYKGNVEGVNVNLEHQEKLQLNEIVIARHHCAILQRIHRNKNYAMEFLTSLAETPNPCRSLLLLLSTILTNPYDGDVIKRCLHCISTVTKDSPQLALDFLPLLLHTLNNCDNFLITFEIITFLPSLGKQKQLIAPILKTITMLGSTSSLLPICIRIATELWKKQPRVFSHLLKLLSKSVDKHSTTLKLQREIVLAKAASLLDICKLRPSQHGPEVVGLLSNIFDEFGQVGDCFGIDADTAESAVLLGLEALKALCEAEVVEFTTAWAAISTKLQKQDSPAVLRGIISLFSICPNVLGRSAAEMNFRDEACNFLWQHVGNKNVHVVSASLAALANFNTDEFKVSHLPADILSWTAEMLNRKQKLKKRPDNDDYDPRNEAIPGPAYVKLVETLQDSATNGYTLLLSKLLNQEAASLPRNISTANTAKRLGAAYDKFLDTIPEFLRSMHEKTKRPAIIPGLAYGLLGCYKSSVQVGKNDKIGRRHLIEDAKVHRQMLDNCLNEIAIPQMDWQHSLSAPALWSYMVAKVFDAVLEGRKAELSLLFDQGRLESEQHLKREVGNSFLWTRDQLTSQLMRASRGVPTMQGNSILALAGLAYKISTEGKDATDFSQSSDDSIQYVNNKDWLVRVADTVMVVFNGNFKPKSEPMQWCQQMSSHKSTASSLIARSSAAIALSLLAVTLIPIDLDRIQQITHALMSRTAGQEQAGTSSVMQFSCAVGLGLLVNRLQQEQFSHITGSDGLNLIRKAHEILETTYCNEQLQNTNGPAIALGLSLAACFMSDSKDLKNNAGVSYKRLSEKIGEMERNKNSSEISENLCLSMAISTVSGFALGCLKANDIIQAVDVIGSINKSRPQSPLVTSAFGILLHGALTCGLARARDVIESSIDTWLQILTNEADIIKDKIAAVFGLTSSFGSYRFLFQFEELDVFDPPLKNKLSVTIKTVQQVLQTTDDTNLCLHCSKLLGLLFMVHDKPSSRQAGLPSSYSYLPEFSLLKATFAYLTEAGKSGPTKTHSSSKISCVLKGLIEASSSTLPPVNWALVFSPIMKLGFDEEARVLCLKFAVKNCATSPVLQTWLVSWLNPQIFLSLEDVCREVVFSEFDVITRIVPMNKLKMVLEEMTVKTFQCQKDNCKLQESVLSGIKKVAVMKNPVQSSLLYVSKALEKITLNLDICKNEERLKSIADCLVNLPKDLQDSLIKNLQENFEISVALDSVMVATKEASLKVFQKSLEQMSAEPESFDSHSLHRIKHALQRHSMQSPLSKTVEDEMFWFLDVTGRSKKLASNKKNSALHCCLELLSSSIATWSLAGIIPTISNQSENMIYTTAYWDTFAAHLTALLQLPRWQHLQNRVIEWLIAVLEIIDPIEGECRIRRFMQDSLISLRNCEAWKSQGIWMKSMDLITL